MTPELAAMFMGKPRPIAIYVGGEARYKDIFKNERYTRFCRYLEPDDTAALIQSEKGFGPPPKGVRFIVSHVWNDFT